MVHFSFTSELRKEKVPESDASIHESLAMLAQYSREGFAVDVEVVLIELGCTRKYFGRQQWLGMGPCPKLHGSTQTLEYYAVEVFVPGEVLLEATVVEYGVG
ncbi:hypothetical protein PT974_10490 [Cladobotryum mycophilum]|uniref:Uncharacterized protein n=1 Tax=Cladobotryum mycophilum TaxID=491253 RepID=A0ABR0S9Z2_9HYPO